MIAEPRKIAPTLTAAQRQLVLASEPGGWGSPEQATGTEIYGPYYRTARKLHALGLGTYSHGSPYGDLYFNNAFGLAVRGILAK